MKEVVSYISIFLWNNLSINGIQTQKIFSLGLESASTAHTTVVVVNPSDHSSLLLY